MAREYAWSIYAVPFAESVAGQTRKPLLVLLAAVGFVLLIACSNIAGLMLARASARGREFAVRTALGAGRRQLLRSVMAESLLLAISGGAAGIALASAGVTALLALAPADIAAGLDPRLETNVLLFCSAVAIASALLFGIAPAWQISHIGTSSVLKSDGYASTAGLSRQRMRSVLVVAETALALMLLVAGGLFLRSFVRLQGVQPGFEPRGVMTAMFSLPRQIYPGANEQAVFERTLLDRLNNTQGVASASLSDTVPFSGFENSDVFEVDGRAPTPGEPLPFGDISFVTPGYFRTLGIPLKRGRYFTSDDRAGGELVTVIDENLARQYWPGEDPVGKRIKRGETYRIIGVAGHVTPSDLADRGKGVVYFSMLQRPTQAAFVLVKAQSELSTTPDTIREAVRQTDPRLAVSAFLGMENAVANSLAPRRFGMRLLAFFSAVALFLAVLGLYGVISYSVTQRGREIGIRMALGAERRGVIRMVVGHGFRLAVIGTALGMIGSVAAARLIQSQLFEVSAFDPWTIAAMATILLAAAVLASYLPARRALQVDPVAALRPE